MLDIYEVRAHVRRDPSRGHVILHQAFQVVIAQYGLIAGDVESSVENGMTKGDPRLQSLLVHWAAEAAGVRELKAQDEVVGAAVSFTMSGEECFPHLRQPRLVRFVDDE